MCCSDSFLITTLQHCIGIKGNPERDSGILFATMYTLMAKRELRDLLKCKLGVGIGEVFIIMSE
jgi:hypothetical protein